MIDYVFRYDPSRTDLDPPPADAEGARRTLIDGNHIYWEWATKCHQGGDSGGGAYIVPCRVAHGPHTPSSGEYPIQRPFAAVLGCSDARVPTEMLFGQGFNDLFVIRVAGNVLGDAVLGSLDFSVVALKESVRVAVVLGHTNCGAVKGAVDAYVDPKKFWTKDYSPALRETFQKIFVAVRESDNAIRQVWGTDAPSWPGYREALVDMGVCLNAAHTAYALRQRIDGIGRADLDVLFGVYDIRTHQVCMPLHPGEPGRPEFINLSRAHTNPDEIAKLATELATIYQNRAFLAPPSASRPGH